MVNWWLRDTREEQSFEKMETVVFLAELEDGDALAANESTAVNGGGPPLVPNGPPARLPPPSPPNSDKLC